MILNDKLTLLPELIQQNNSRTIEANFIPSVKSTPLPQLYALRAKAQEQLEEIETRNKAQRKSLAKRIIALKSRVKSKAYTEGMSEVRSQLAAKLAIANVKSKEIISNAHRDSLSIIKSVYLAVFDQDPKLQHELLSSLLAKAFQTLSDANQIKVILSPGTTFSNLPATEVCEDPKISPGTAVIECKSGIIKLDLRENIKEGFEILEQKLEESLLKEL